MIRSSSSGSDRIYEMSFQLRFSVIIVIGIKNIPRFGVVLSRLTVSLVCVRDGMQWHGAYILPLCFCSYLFEYFFIS